MDGAVVNTGAGLPLGGQTGGYTADIANAQEINIQLSGALGESETGGASINIVPRTGGNRYAGDFNTTYTRDDWFDRNNQRLPERPGAAFRRSSSRSRRLGRLRRPDQARPAVVLLAGARPGHPQAAGRRRLLAEPERREVGLQLPARSRGAARRIQEHVEQRERAHHVAGDAEEQVQHLLGRAGLLPGPVPRRRVGLHVARVVVVGRRSSRTGCSRCRGPTRSRTGSCSRPASASRDRTTTPRSIVEYTNPHRHSARRRDRRHRGLDGDGARASTVRRRRVLQLTSGSLELRHRRRLGAEIREDRQLSLPRVGLLRQRRAHAKFGLRRRLLHAAPDQQGERPAAHLQLRLARRRPASLTNSLRQHEPAVPRGPEQPGAAPGPEHARVQHRARDAATIT